MILKFDHISYVTDRKKKAQILKNLKQPLFKEINLRNMNNKALLMELPQENHDLYYFDDDIPIEYIFYDNVKGKSGVSIENGTIVGHYNNLEKAYGLMNGLFPGKVSYDNSVIMCNLSGVLDKKDFFLKLLYEPRLFKDRVTLDTEGYGEIALIHKGIRANTSSEEKLIVNGKELHISFVYSESVDIIFELIRFGK